MKIEVKRLENEVRMGDWHDKPLKWETLGPDAERQIFSTKKDAKLYRKFRKESSSLAEASKKFAAA